METAQRDSWTPAFSGESPKIVPVQGADEVDGVFRIHFRAAERLGSPARRTAVEESKKLHCAASGATASSAAVRHTALRFTTAIDLVS